MSDEGSELEFEIEISKTVKYTAMVPSVHEAFSFVMDRLETVGPDPHIEIRPTWVEPGTAVGLRVFEVAVAGTMPEDSEIETLDGL